MVRRRSHPGVRLSLLALAGSVAAYAAWAGTAVGRRFDAAVLDRDVDHGWEWPSNLAIMTLREPIVALTVLFLCLVAVWDRRVADAARAAVLVAATVALSHLAEKALAEFDPLGVETLRALGPAWFPSGHAAAAMALALAVPLVAPAQLRRPGLLMAAAAWPAFVMWALIVDRGHMVGDVVGGVLLATVVAGALVIGRRSEPRPPCPLPWPAVAIAAAALVGGAGVLAAADGLSTPHTLLQPMVLLAAAGTLVLALGLMHAFERTLAAEAVS